MTATVRLTLLVLIAALLAPAAVGAQDKRSPAGPRLQPSLDTPIEIPPSRFLQPGSGSGGKPVLVGVLVGAGAALGLTAAAAARYGENEGGTFCSRCMVQWSAVTLPVGAAIGAGIGYGVKRARRSITAAPLFSRRAAGVVVSANF